MKTQAIEVTNLAKSFELSKGKTIQILNGLSLSANYGEFISILGVSGSGKSTLLKCMSGLLQPSQGKVEIQGLDPYQTSPNKLAKLRRESLAFIFQSYNLVPALPIIENIALPLRLSGKKVNNQEILELLEKLQFKADSKAFPSTLSGGEQQRVAIARAIVNNPKVLIADEPTGNLDPEISWEIMQLLERINLQGTTVLMATHNKQIVDNLRHRVIAIEDGRIVRDEEEGEYGYND